MSKTKDNGRAFPDTKALDQPGMTLLDYFAGQVLAGYCAAHDEEGSPTVNQIGEELIASTCYDIAAAMMKEREKRSTR